MKNITTDYEKDFHAWTLENHVSRPYVLAYLNIPTLNQPEAFIHAKDGLFDENGDIGAASKQFLQNRMDQYVTWVKKHVD